MTLYQTIGHSSPPIDGIGKVTGQTLYTADVSLPFVLWGKSLRSPYPHARIRNIDISKAKVLKGVHTILTGENVRGVLYGRRLRDTPVLAWDIVRFAGERVAAVAAENKDIVEEALGLIKVEYEELLPLLNPLAAMEDSALLIHPDIMSYSGLPQPLAKPSNIFSHNTWGKGDIENGFALSDDIITNTFTTPRVHQAYLEPHTCLVWIDEYDIVQIWASNKTPYNLRKELSDATGLPLEQFQVNFRAIGGDFGGKGSPMEVPLCYYLALHSKRPVKMVMDYVDEFMASNPRHWSSVQVKTGIKNNGVILAQHVIGIFDSGAYGGFKPNVNLTGFAHAGAPYKTPHTKIEAIQVYTNTVPCGHMRGPGEPQAAFAVESQLDILARKLNMDPLELRLKNLIDMGDEDALGQRFKGVQVKQTLEAAVSASGYRLPRAYKIGLGMAVSDRPPGSGESHATVTLNPDGLVLLGTPIFEQGVGTYTLQAQIVAEELGVPIEQVKLEVWNTGNIDYDSGIGASRVTRIGTQVLHAALDNVKAELINLSIEFLGIPQGSVTFIEGDLKNLSTGEIYSWKNLLNVASRSVTGLGSFRDLSTSPVTAYVAQVAEVSVDLETGAVKVLRLTTAHDVGKIINPLAHQGQINGGVIQGIGFALMEELRVEDGRVTTLTFGDYKIPTIMDIPELLTILVESKNGVGPYNVKSIGENPIIPVAAAIANAVEDAVGVRIKDLPVTAEKVYWALKEKHQE